ncbi:phage portal protein [Marinibacterium sp. SX1]|uniref:phage portal protein n=1 Tax=Marinibacterium sp. SX1 TaxID=3388424 RepID=UPI003D17CFD9
MNWLDQAITLVAPGWGERRLAARSRLKVRMNYDGATRGRRSGGWAAPSTSADAAGTLGGARIRMRDLARDMVRNRPFAARGVSVILGNVVANGILPSVAAADAGVRQDAQSVVAEHLLSPWLDAQGVLSLPAMQRAVMSNVVQDGEILVRRRWRQGTFARGLALPFQVELLEADYLNTWLTSWGQNEVIEGVEYGPTGAVVAYHLYRQHPGGASRRMNLESVRVPATDILHIRRIDRAGQTRGVSWFAPVLLTLGDLADYQEGELLKQKIAALMAGFITSDDDDYEPSNEDGEALAEGIGLASIEPGTFTELPRNKSIIFSTPPKIEGYDGFMRQTLSAIAMGLGITYEALAGDLSKVNFSSARMGRMEMDRNVEAWQQLIMIDQFCNGIGRWVADAWAIRFGAPPGFSLTWTPPRRPLIDPREMTALIAEIDAGLNSTQRGIRQLGRDPEVIRRERAEDARHAPARPLGAASGPVPVADDDDDEDDEEEQET